MNDRYKFTFLLLLLPASLFAQTDLKVSGHSIVGGKTYLVKGETTTFELHVENLGNQQGDIPKASVLVYEYDGGTYTQVFTCDATNAICPPLGNVDITMPFDFTPSKSGTYQMTMKIEPSNDPNTSNNTITIYLYAADEDLGPRTNANHFNAGQAGDPVNAFTGGFHFEPKPDLSPSGPMLVPYPAPYRRYYSSSLTESAFFDGVLGEGWLHSFEHLLIDKKTSGNLVEVLTTGGLYIPFYSIGSLWFPHFPKGRMFRLSEWQGGWYFYNSLEELGYLFDSNGVLTKIDDTYGNELTLSYGANGKVSTVSDGRGNTLTFTYDGNDMLVSVTDGTRTVAYTYTNNLLTGFTDVMGNQVNYTYDGPSNKLATYTDQNGNTQVTNTYTNGKVSSQQDALGNNWSFSYPEIGKCIATDPLTNQHIYVHNEHGTLFDYTDPQGNHVLFDVDEEQRTTTMTNRLGGTRKFTYSNSHEQPLSIEDENGNKTEFTYAFRSHNDLRLFELTNIDLPDGSTRSFTYDANWNLNGATDGEGNTSTFTHNDRGQILTALLPDRGTRTFTYDANRNLSTATDGEGNTTTYTYDGLNRLTSTKLADGNTRQLEYDDAGNVTKWTDEAGNSIGMTYDKTNNLTSITDREGNTHRTEYNAAGLPERLIDAEGNSTTLAYDALKRLASGTDPEGYTERWTYNKLGWLNSYTDQLNRSFTMGYNDEGLPISFANPLGHTTTVARDAVGHTIGVTTPLGLTTTYSRDELGRLTKVESPMGKQVQYGRNLNGWVTSINLPQPGISYGYTYNDAGDVTSATDGLGSAWTYEYNDNGNLIGYTGPTGNRIAFEYDLRQRRTTTTYPGGLGTLTNSYSATGLPIETAYSDGDTWNSTYDKDGRLLTTKGVSNLYDKNGRIISSNGVAMNRDRNGRIFSTLIDGKYTDYKYDGAGNLLEVKDWTDGVTTFVYDAAHRLYSVEYPNSVKMIIGYDNDSRKTGIWYENIGSQQATHSEQVTYNDDGQFVSKNQYFPILHSAINFSLSTAYNQASQRDDATYDALGRLETHSSLTYAYANGTDLVEVNDTQGNGIKNEFDAFGNIVRIANTHDNDEIELGWAFYEGRSSAYKTTTPDVTGLNVLTPDGIPLYLRDRDTGSKLWFYHSNLSGDLRFTTDENANVDATRLLSPYGGFIGDAGSMPVGSPSGPGGSIQVGEWPIFILGSTPIDHRTLQQMIPRTGPPHGNRYSAAGADLLGGRSLFLGESGSYHTYDNFEDIRFASSSQGNSNSYFGLGPGAYSSSSSSSSVGYFDIAGARFKGWKTGIDLGFSSFNESAQGGQPLSKVDYSSDRDPSFAGAGDAYLSDFSTSLGSNKAEFGGSTGLVINAVTKSRIKASPVNRYLDSEQWRYDEPFQVDLRTAYHPELGPPDAEISQNVFNVFNSSTILDSRSSANSSLFGSPVEVLGPRNIRFGGRPRF